MIAKLTILISVFLIVQSTSLYSLVDDVNKQLDQLKEILRGNLLEAHSELTDQQIDFLLFSQQTESAGLLSLQQQYEKIRGNIDTLKELGASANVNVSSCVDKQAIQIATIGNDYIHLLENCTSELNLEQEEITNSTRSAINLIIVKVRLLESSVENCKEDVSCLQPLLTEIELDKIRLPQNIATEVDVNGSQLQTLSISVQDCSDRNVVGYTDDSDTIYNTMVSCVNNLID